MLRLGPPYFMFEDVPVMGDAHDPDQFYYFPNRPHVPIDDQGKPTIRLLILKDMDNQIVLDQQNGTQTGSDDDIAGFVFFDTVLSWPEQTLKKVQKEIEDSLSETRPPNPDGTPLDIAIRLGPLPFRQGGVQLTFLDQKTAPVILDPVDPDAPVVPVVQGGEPSLSEWVTFLSAPATPSLFGENRAVFMAELTRKATMLLYGSFDGLIPASVMYDLEYVGQMQAYNVKVSADWDQVFNFVQNKFDMNILFFQTEIDDIVQELEDQQIIKIEAEVDATDSIDPAALEKEFNDIRKELQDMVLETFFEPKPGPFEVEPLADSDFDNIVDSATRAWMLYSGYGTASFERKSVSATELRSLEIDYTVRRAVKRRIAPQAHINVLFDDLNLTRDDVVTVVDASDDIWRQSAFTASVVADFDGDGIQTIVMDVQYVKESDFAAEPNPDVNPDAIWSFVFNNADQVFRKESWFDPDIGPSLFYRYRIFFDPNGLPGPAATTTTSWQRVDSQRVVANTRDVFEREVVNIQAASSFDWERYPEVLVRLRYDDPMSSWLHEESKLLDATDGRLSTVFRQRAKDGISPEFSLMYLRDDGEAIETAWEDVSGALTVLRSPDPAVNKITFTVVPDSTLVTMIVNAQYEDPENNIFEDFSFVVTQANIGEMPTWEIPWKDLSKRRFKVQQISFDSDGNVSDTGFVETEARTVILGKRFASTFDVQPKLIGPSLADQDVDKAILRMRYVDPTDGEEISYLHEFTETDDGAKFRIKLKDASARSYFYEMTFVLNSGFTKTTGERVSSDKFLILSSQVPA